MTNLVQFEILKEGVELWNKWRAQNPGVAIDLSGSDLYGANLSRVNLNAANLQRAFLEKADLGKADLLGANLSYANLIDANLFDANLTGANLRRANLYGANLIGANLRAANLTGTTLANAVLTRAGIDRAKVSGSRVYGVNVWGLEGEFEEQRDLIITHKGQPKITVDNIKVAQLIYLILNSAEIRDAINTFTSKTVLVLGRFLPPERKAILEALKNGLREYNLIPIVLELDRRMNKDFSETIKTLASLSYFVIADLTNPKSSPLELQGRLPDCQIPFVPIIKVGEQPLSMLVDFPKTYTWVLDRVPYSSAEGLIKVLKSEIIDPAIKKHNKLSFDEAIEQRIRSAKDFLGKGEK
jgi:uncharacterized protein YjbI with pentapeptide repeats